MADVLPSVSKKRKLEDFEDDSDDIFHYFYNEYEHFDHFIAAYAKLLTDIDHALLPSVISFCDAHTSSRYGRSFTQSECEAKPDPNSPFHFGTFFARGIKIHSYLKKKQIPEEKDLKIVTSKLLRFLLDKEWHDELGKIEGMGYVTRETQVMVTLAEHLFSKLSVPKEYVIDKLANKSDMILCKCGKCRKEDLNFDDTSIGHPKVWHGSMDIVFESCEVAISVPKLEKDEDASPDGCSTAEIENLDTLQTRSQIITQTIVFSLLHKKKHPLSPHFLIPNIVANAEYLKFFFYDPENDVLLESKKYLIVYKNLPFLHVFETVIATWLILNHKVLCSGPYREFLTKAPKSKFTEFAKEALQIYESELKYRNISLGRKQQQRPFADWDYLKMIHHSGFVWPASVVKPDVD